MITIHARNVNDAYSQGYALLRTAGAWPENVHATRGGRAVVAPGPVATRYALPRERVLFDAGRDANPFFHLMEALWMLDGRRDVESLAVYLPRIAQYSDDGREFHGAYGWRWRRHFGFDQLDELAQLLRRTPSTRQACLAMWDARCDLGGAAGAATTDGVPARDIPCNLLAKFDLRAGQLCLSVLCRSNDMVWGAYGANVVTFSILQEYMASRLGVEVGWYEQVSLDFHAYTDVFDGLPAPEEGGRDWYAEGGARPGRLMTVEHDRWREELSRWGEEGWRGRYDDAFFRGVAAPMARAHEAYRAGELREAKLAAFDVEASDWRLAALGWLERRWERRQAKAAAAPPVAAAVDEPERDGLV